MPLNSEKERTRKILEILSREYPEVKPALDFNNPFELLVATILSAQCTDDRVNIVTKTLFKKYKTPEDFVAASSEELEKDIFSTGFYKQKAKSLKKCSEELIKYYNGQIPKDFESLNKLPGVGRKTASVVVANAFGIPAVPVDTHVKRLANLLGFIDSDDPEKIEFRIKELVPEEQWINASHLLINHGRKICVARKPKCSICPIADLCPSYKP